MRWTDRYRLAWANLKRNRTRTVLTFVGVVIGVAALTALLSYGLGVQQSARREFNALELYNTLRVTSSPSPFNSLGDMAVRQTPVADPSAPSVVLTDSLVAILAQIEGVLAAYPEVTFPVEVVANGREVVASAEAIPMAFQEIPSYQPIAGTFFITPTDSSLLLSPSMAKRLGFDPPETIIGQPVVLKTAVFDFVEMQKAMVSMRFGMTTLPLGQVENPMSVAGLLSEENQPFAGFFRVLLPLERARTLRKVTFFSTLDLMLTNAHANQGGYAAVRVQLQDLDAYEQVRADIETHGVYVASFREQFQQLERLFLLMDLAFGIVGLIALLVATLGIANTMMMNVMERFREIGVMKAVGGEEGDLQKLFMAESILMGMGGGLAGMILGWGITALIQVAIDYYLGRLGVPSIQVFYHPPLLWVGILGVAVGVSLMAGYFPARKAARIDPVEALRF